MKQFILTISLVILSTLAFSQINHDFDTELSCSHVKSQLGNDFSRYLYYWQSEYMDDYDVTFYHLDIEVSNTSLFIQGNSTMNAIALVNIDTFAIELKSFQTITQILIDGVEYTTYDRIDDNVIVPIAEIPAGNSFSAQIFYNGIPPSGGFFSGMTNSTSPYGKGVTWTLSEPFAASDWFPVKQDLEDKADSVWVFLTTANSNMAGSQGLLTNIVDLGNGNSRYEWKSNYPIDYYLISFAVSEYQEYNVYAHPEEMNGDSILIQNFIYDDPQCLVDNKDQIDETATMIELLSDLYILYPFHEEKYGHCLTQLGGGMEHQTMTTIGGFPFWLVAHELGHMWFGDNVTCATWSDIWINEGFATYSDYLCQEFILGWSAAQATISAKQTNVLSQPGGSVYIPIDQITPDNVGRIFSGRLSYNKGASIVHMLRHEINDDELFFDVMETFQTNFSDSTATGEDFKNTAEDITGMQWDDFFDQWYYGEGYPIYDIEYYNSGGKNYFDILQTPSASTPFFDQHVDLGLYFTDGTDTTISYHHNESYESFSITTGKEVMYLEVDPYDWNLEKSSFSVNVKENLSPLNFKLGQNQTTGDLTLYFSNNTLSNKSISITDISGKVVYSSQTEMNVTKINTSHLSNGVYIISASNGNNTFVERFVK